MQPVELARKLAKEMDEHKTVSISRVYVPNEYVLYLAPNDRKEFATYEASLLTELADYLSEHARREGYSLLSTPKVLMEEDDDLQMGEFGIATRLVQAPKEQGAAKLEAPPEPVMMTAVVEGGTGVAAQIPGVPVAGKTGTAETGRAGENDTWFIAFAPADNPEVAVAVALSNQSGTGGATAAPIAKEIIEALLR